MAPKTPTFKVAVQVKLTEEPTLLVWLLGVRTTDDISWSGTEQHKSDKKRCHTAQQIIRNTFMLRKSEVISRKTFEILDNIKQITYRNM